MEFLPFPSLQLLHLNNICTAKEIQRNNDSYLHRSLETSMRDFKPVAIQLCMLEVFTSDESYYNPTDPVRSRKDAVIVTVYLVRNSNYNCYIKFRASSLPANKASVPAPICVYLNFLAKKEQYVIQFIVLSLFLCGISCTPFIQAIKYFLCCLCHLMFHFVIIVIVVSR